jgi:hypothetical protein
MPQRKCGSPCDCFIKKDSLQLKVRADRIRHKNGGGGLLMGVLDKFTFLTISPKLILVSFKKLGSIAHRILGKKRLDYTTRDVVDASIPLSVIINGRSRRGEAPSFIF